MQCRRDPTENDAIAGALPRSVFEPSSRDECLDIFKAARAEKLALAVVGGGTELGLGARPEPLDAVILTRRLDRIIEYAPSDQVVVVEAGVTLASLQAVLANHRQRLACDPPLAERATVGGLLATNAFGPLRTQRGSLRDLLIGVSIVRADGSVARGGGKVVKNVAGFDLPKLIVGSLGTLGMISTATFRLHPLPETTATLRARGMTPGAVRGLVVAMQREQLEPAALVAMTSGSAFDVLVGFEGFAAGVAQQHGRSAALFAALAASVELLSLASAKAAWGEHDAARTRGSARVKFSTLAGALERMTTDVTPRLMGALAASTTILYPTLGLGFVTGDVDDAAAFAEAVTVARAHLASAHGSLVVEHLPSAARSVVNVWGPPPSSFALMKRVKERFDPERRLNPGRFVGGL